MLVPCPSFSWNVPAECRGKCKRQLKSKISDQKSGETRMTILPDSGDVEEELIAGVIMDSVHDPGVDEVSQ